MLTIKETAERLGVCAKTVRTLIGKRALIASQVGRQWRISESELAAYLARGSTTLRSTQDSKTLRSFPRVSNG